MELKLDELEAGLTEESLLNTVSPEISLQARQVNSAKDDDESEVNEEEDSDIQEAENEMASHLQAQRGGRKSQRE